MSISRDSAVTFIGRISIFLLQGVAAIFLARSLGPEGRGIYALIVTVPHIAAMICNFGFATSSAYFISSGKIAKERVFTVALLVPFLTGGIAFMLLYFLARFYVQIYTEVPIALFRWSLLLIPFIAFFNNALATLQGEKRFFSFNLVNLFNPAGFLIAFILGVIILNLGIRGAIYSWQFGFLLAGIAAVLLSQKRMHLDLQYFWRDLQGMLKYSSRVAVAELLTFLNYRLDIFLVGYFLDTVAVGWYTIAVVIAETLWFLSSAIANVLLPNLAERSIAQAQALFGKAFRFVLWSTLFMVMTLLLVDRLALSLVFGQDFLPALLPLRLLYPGVLLLSLSKVLSSYILARGKPGITMRVATLGVIINLLLNLWLIPKIGISGAAVASSLAYGAMFVSGLLWFLRQNQLPARAFVVIQRSDLQIFSGWLKKQLPKFRAGRSDD